jgi:hypothetical protein
MREARSNRRARRSEQPHTAHASMKVQRQTSAPARNRRKTGGQGPLHVGIAVENLAEAVFDHDADVQVGTVCLEQRESGRGQHAVAERPQADHRDPRAFRQPLQNAGHATLRWALRRPASPEYRRGSRRRACTGRTASRLRPASAPPWPCTAGRPECPVDLADRHRNVSLPRSCRVGRRHVPRAAQVQLRSGDGGPCRLSGAPRTVASGAARR